MSTYYNRVETEREIPKLKFILTNRHLEYMAIPTESN